MTRTNVLKTLFLAAAIGRIPLAQAADALACNLKALTQTERSRHHELGRRWRAAVVDRRDIADGYAFHVDAAKASIMELAEWVGYEQKCCPFLRFRIDVDESGAAWLTLSGRAGVKQFLATDLSL